MVRHYAKYSNEEYIVLGHNAKYNNCMLVRMVALPIEEQADLRAIATSDIAQKHHYYLLPVLMTQTHRSGKSWADYLLEQVNRRGGPVTTLPLKEIQDSLDSEQKAVWKGYGKPNPGHVVNPNQLSHDGRALQEAYHPGSTHPASTVVSPPSIPASALGHSPVDAGLDRKLDELSVTIADESRLTREAITNLANVLAAAFAPKADKAEAPAVPHDEDYYGDGAGKASKRRGSKVE